jgi:Ca2+-binding RTX toxin-like protein
MTTIQYLFEQGQLAEAAYASYIDNAGNLITSDSGVISTLQTEGMSESQATEFATHWRVVGQYATGIQSGDPFWTWNGTGFSATLFESKDNPGQYTFAIRGSKDIDDFKADAGLIFNDGIAPSQVVDMYNYWQSLTHSGVYQAARLEFSSLETATLSALRTLAVNPAAQAAYKAYLASLWAAGAIIDSDALVPKVAHLVFGNSNTLLSDPQLQIGSGILTNVPASIDVAGHSLGGHLAMTFTRLFPSANANAVTTNGLGFKLGNANVDTLLSQLAGAPDFNPTQIQSIYGIAGPEFAAMNSFILQQPGGYDGIFIESGGLGTVGGHSAAQMTDSLAIYALFAKLDPTLNINALDTIDRLLKASANLPANSLEGALASLGKLFGKTYSAVETTRDDLYTTLFDLLENTLFKSLIGKVTTELATADLDTRARNDFSALVSLVTLSPIVLTGSSALLEGALGTAWSTEFSQWQADALLTAEQRAAGQANFSDQYLADRATMLAWLLKGNQQDALSNGQTMFVKTTQPGVSDIWQFTDSASKRTIEVSPTLAQGRHDIYFGDDNGNGFTGGLRSDNLYGGGGNDSLDGSKGNDYLEGNAGNDDLDGSEGRDTLGGGAGNDTLEGGKENDILNGGPGDDSYTFVSGDGRDWIDDPDGNGHIEYDGITLGQATLTYVSANVWQEQIGSNTFTYSLYTRTEGTESYPYLSIQGLDGGMWVKRWQQGQFGITLPDAPAQAIIPVVTLPIETKRSSWYEKDHAIIDASNLAGVAVGAVGDYGEVFGSGKIVGNGQDNRLIGGVGDDWLTGDAGRDTLVANGGNDKLYGGIGDDALSAGDGNDLLDGGSGSDVLSGGHGSDILEGGDGDDFLFGGGSYTAIRSDWAVIPASGPDQAALFDKFIGVLSLADDGADVLDGGAGNDELWGGEGGDMLDGGTGDDLLVGDSEGDYLIGGDGDDKLIGDGAQSANGSYSVLPAYQGNDILDGGAGNDVLAGDGGSDDLYGGDGNDTLSGDAKGVPIEYQGEDFLDGGAGDDKLFGDGKDDRLFGGSGDDELQGDSKHVAPADQGNDFIDGQDGNDDLTGNGGNDTLFGGTGDDMLFGDTDDTPVENRGDDYLDGQEGDDYLRGYEGNDILIGGSGSDDLLAEAGNDALEGNDGEDTLFAGEGDDSLNGGAGTDYMNGGAGDDTYFFATGDSPINAFWRADSVVDSEGRNTIVFENAVAQNLALAWAYYGGHLVIYYGPGDTLLVEGGFAGAVSTYVFADNERLSFTELIGRLYDGVVGSTTGAGQHVLTGGRDNNQIVGLNGGSLFSGGRGNDFLTGDGGGNTYLYGAGDGSDTITDNSKANGFMAANTLRFGAGISSADITLGIGSLLIRAGNSPDNVIHIEGFTPDDVLAQKTIDRFEFADGSVLSYAQLLERGFDLTGNSGNDVLTGTNIGDRIDGMGGDDILRGGAGDDAMLGGAGDDILLGGAGNDTLIGGSGSDALYGGAGDDTLQVAVDGNWSAAFAAFNAGSPGQTGSGELVNISGKARLFDLLDGGSGDDLLQGTSGNDGIFLDDDFSPLPVVMGPRVVGIEAIRTGDGDDVVDLTSNRYAYGNLLLDGGNGNDVLWASAGNDAIEGGSGIDRLYGGAGGDLLAGGTDDDTLNGASGADLLIGGAGNDTITSGAGDDLIAFNQGDGFDTIDVDAGNKTLTLGGGIAYGDLTLRKNGFDLVLDTGNGDAMSFRNWYFGATRRNVLKLQVIAEAMAGFDAASADPLLNRKIEDFDFIGLVGAFDDARTEMPALSTWSLANALTQFHLSASDSAALGGDLAYQYGRHGTLAGIGVGAAQQVLGDAGFGSQAQTLQALAGLPVGGQRLS